MAVNLLRSLGSGLNAGLRGLGLRRSPDPEIDADYTRGLIRSFLVRLGRSAASLKGERILMVGPGYDLHSSLVLAGHGVEVTVVEKYLNDWITSFHPPFYESVLETLAEDWPGIDPTPIERVLSRATHEGVPGVRILRCGLEEIDEVAGGSMDITLSNAVFEHLANAKAAIEQLHRVTRPGGIGTHQIDMRWHLDFERPLEYCAMSDVEFANELSRTNCGCGNRHRYDEFSSFFESAGFVIDKLEPNLFADDDYLDDLIPRAQPRFQAMGKEVLRILSAHYLVLKPQE